MRILYISQYFHPEIGATTNRAAAIATELCKRGHHVVLLCEMPNHPAGVIFPGYKGKLFCREDFHGIPVIHLPVIASPRKNFLNRILMYLSFSVSAAGYIMFRRPRYDLIYVSSPPLFVALCGLLSKLLFSRRKFVFEVRDLWPDSAIELGELNNGMLIRFSTALEQRAYRKSDLVIAATDYIGKIIQTKGTPAEKVFVNRNGVDSVVLETFAEKESRPAGALFTAIFAGNMGVAQNLETVIRCAGILADEPIRFVFIGGGPGKAKLQQLSRSLQLDKVEFRDQVPKAEIGKALSAADCGIVCLKDLPVLSGALPVKIFDYMAYELPIVCGIRGEAADVVNEAGAGIVVMPDDPQDMAEALRKLMREPHTCSTMGKSGRDYVLSRFQRSQLAAALVSDLESRFCPGES